MNDKIRQAVRDEMERRGLSQVKLAQALNLERPNLTKMLSGKVGKIPQSWQDVLDYLGLELTVKPKE